MPIWASVAGKPGIHKAEAVQKLRARAEGAADSRNTRALVQGKGGRDVENLVHLRFGRLGHPPSCVGREGVQIPTRALGVENAQGEGGFAGTGEPGNADNLIERYIHINIFQVMDSCSADFNFINHGMSFPLCKILWG